MSDAPSNAAADDSNPFATPASGDTSVLPWLHVVAISTGVLIGLLVLTLSLYCAWEVVRYLQIFTLNADPDEPFLSQLDDTQLIETIAVLLLI